MPKDNKTQDVAVEAKPEPKVVPKSTEKRKKIMKEANSGEKSFSFVPAIGRLVHYNHDGQWFPAIIVEVHPSKRDGLRLKVFTSVGDMYKNGVKEGNLEGQWKVPARV